MPSDSFYSQLSPCGHLAIKFTPQTRTAAKLPSVNFYRRLTETISRYYGLSLLRTLTRVPDNIRNNGSCLYLFSDQNVGFSVPKLTVTLCSCIVLKIEVTKASFVLLESKLNEFTKRHYENYAPKANRPKCVNKFYIFCLFCSEIKSLIFLCTP